MIDVLAPLGLLLFVGFVVAFVLAARKQRQARGKIFQELAADAGWRHLAVDDGTAEALAQGFDDFARFSSPSLGKLTPKNVVLGDVDEGRLCAFVHGTREHEDQARQWFVCLIEAPRPLCDAALVRTRGAEARRVRELGVAPEVSFAEDRAFHREFLVRARDGSPRTVEPLEIREEHRIRPAGDLERNVLRVAALEVEPRQIDLATLHRLEERGHLDLANEVRRQEAGRDEENGQVSLPKLRVLRAHEWGDPECQRVVDVQRREHSGRADGNLGRVAFSRSASLQVHGL